MQRNLAKLSLQEANGIITKAKQFIDGSNGNLSIGLKKQIVGAMYPLRKKVEQKEKEIRLGKAPDDMISVSKTSLFSINSLLPQ
jgi:hypothetical protein